MRLINNRYRIDGMVEKDHGDECYIIRDLWDKDTKEFMRIFDREKNNQIVSHYIDNFLGLSQIKHRTLLKSYRFGIIETINLKKINNILYYVVSEYTESPTLDKVKIEPDLAHRLYLILELMTVIDFIHFRGFIYKYLCPSHVYYCGKDGIKLLNISTILEKSLSSFFDDFSDDYFAPEVLKNKIDIDFKSDNYSLGMMMKYLLLKNFSSSDGNLNFYDELNIDEDKKNVLIDIINNLTHRKPEDRNISIRDHIDNIIKTFSLDYKYDLTEERDTLFLQTKTIGFEKEISQLIEIDNNIKNNTNSYKGCIINGINGTGKTKLINEIAFRLDMLGRSVFKLDISDNDSLGNLNISNLLKKIISNAPKDIVDRYLEDFTRLLPEQNSNAKISELDLSHTNGKYKIFNRICNLIIDISKYEPGYLIIDNIQKSNETFIEFIDYLLRNMPSNKFFLIMSYKESIKDSGNIPYRLNCWSKDQTVTNIILKNFSLNNTSLLVKGILGISYIPHKFSEAIYKETKGNPKYIDFVIKDLYNSGQLYLHKDGCWELKNNNLSQINFPSNFSETIVNQLKKYDDTYLYVLRAIAIFNAKLSKRMLLNMVNLDFDSLDSILNDLIEDRIVDEDEEDWGYNYSLSFDELKRYVYSSIPVDQKQELHIRASKSLIDIYSDNIKLILEELVYHLEEAKEIDLGVEVVIQEADKLVNKESTNSIKLWELAYNIVENRVQKDKLKILDKLTDLYLIKGDTEKTQYYLERLTKEAEDERNIPFLINAKLYKAETLLRTNDLVSLNILIESIEAISRENSNQEGIIQSLIIKAKMLLSSDDLHHILDITQEALNISKEFNINKYNGTINNLNGIIYNLKGNIEAAIEEYKNSINSFADSDKPYEVVKPINNLGNIYGESFGDIEKSLEYYEQALALSEKFGMNQVQTIFLNNIGDVFYDLTEYKKSIGYIKEAHKIAENSNDVKSIFSSNIYLGNIYLSTNHLDKAFDKFMFLDKMNSSNPILDAEINYLYNNFLGEFYFCFGKLDLSEKYSLIASELYKDYNIKGHLKAECRLKYIIFIKEGKVDERSIYSIIDRYTQAGIKYDSLKFILTMAKLTLINSDYELAKKLMLEYEKLNKNITSSFLNYNSKIIELLLCDDEPSLIEVENIFSNMQSNDLLFIDVDFRIYLGNKYLGKNIYSKSLRQFLEALDILYKLGKNISDNDFRMSLIKSKNSDAIKKNIVYIMKNGYKKDIAYLTTLNICNENYEEYFDTNPIIEGLSKEEFYDVLYYQDRDFNIMNLSDLLYQLNENYKENLKIILRYAGRETIAKRGLIITINEEIGSLEILASLLDDDENLPDEIILLNALRSKDPFLFNRNCKDSIKSSMENILTNNVTGVICIPISSHERYTENVDRRRWEHIQDNKVIGYIYLETSRALNRFDLERYHLTSGLSKLIYLNIENERLRKIATTDKVTGIYTRKFFEDRLDKMLDYYKQTNNSFSLLMIDIDKFKNINDTYGHLKGDQVLNLMGSTILNSIRDADMVGRYGGEEFIAILNNINLEKGLEIANKIRENIAALQINGINRPITVSIGVSQYPQHSTFKDELIFKADQALYYAKEVLGRNKSVFWDSSMDITSNKVDKLTGVVTGNLERDNHNLLALVDIAELIKENKTYKEKSYDFLGKIIDIVEGEYASLLIYGNIIQGEPITRRRKSNNWTKNNFINYGLINRVIETKKGEHFIDWDNADNMDKLLENPNWQSILILPLIKDNNIKGIVYITVSLKEKEFDIMDLNICNILSNIFVGNTK